MKADVFNYSDTCIVIAANDVVFDCKGHIIDGTKSSYSVGVDVYGKNVTVKNCTISDFVFGISAISAAANVTIVNNTIDDCTVSLDIEVADNITVRNNVFNSSYGYAVQTLYSSGNVIFNNQFNTKYAILFYRSANNQVFGNTYSGVITAYYLDSADGNYIHDEDASGGNVVLKAGSDSNRFENIRSGDISVSGNNNTFFNVSMEDYVFPLTILGDNNVFEHCEIRGYETDILGNNNRILNSTVLSGKIVIEDGASYNQISRNKITGYSKNTKCIVFENSGSWNTISFNNITFCDVGIDVESNTTVYGNILSDTNVGIVINGNQNQIVDNLVQFAGDSGIKIYGYQNSLIGNYFCRNRNYDIYANNESVGSSTYGENNTCGRTLNFNDVGQTECTYVCGGTCYCSSCEECSQKLNNYFCGIVYLTNDIVLTGTNNYCLSFDASYKTFSCSGHVIYFTQSSEDFMYDPYAGHDNTFQDCVMTCSEDGCVFNVNLGNNIVKRFRVVDVNSSGAYGLFSARKIYDSQFEHSRIGILFPENALLINNTFINNQYLYLEASDEEFGVGGLSFKHNRFYNNFMTFTLRIFEFSNNTFENNTFTFNEFDPYDPQPPRLASSDNSGEGILSNNKFY